MSGCCHCGACVCDVDDGEPYFATNYIEGLRAASAERDALAARLALALEALDAAIRRIRDGEA